VEATQVRTSIVVGAAAAFVLLGYAAASRTRTLSRTGTVTPTRLVALSLGIGAVLGVANLAANWAIAEAHPMFRALLTERMAVIRPRDAIVAAPLVEEVAVRLFLMSVMAWIGFRLTSRAGAAFAVALIGSSLVFALLHLFRPIPGDPALANAYRAALVVKYTLAGLPLGWIFWRWGLPYSMLCHGAANAAHISLEGWVF
jgi:hypothetical protein